MYMGMKNPPWERIFVQSFIFHIFLPICRLLSGLSRIAEAEIHISSLWDYPWFDGLNFRHVAFSMNQTIHIIVLDSSGCWVLISEFWKWCIVCRTGKTDMKPACWKPENPATCCWVAKLGEKFLYTNLLDSIPTLVCHIHFFPGRIQFVC